MKIRLSRTAGIFVFASALVAGGLVFAAPSAKKPAPSTRGQAAEYASMCKYCETATNGACYAFQTASRAAVLPAADGGMNTEGACSYPPCSTEPMMAKGLAELKLACASCRAMCPKTSGGGAQPAVQTAPDPSK